VSDAARVFALHVQVNPVPEPDLLPLTRVEAELPTIEGSTVMDTRDIVDTSGRIEVRPPGRVRRWKPAVVVAVAFVVVLGVIGGVLLLSGDGDGGPVAAADESEPTLSDSLTGAVWVTTGDKFVVFLDDGTYGVGTSAVLDDVTTADIEWGTWSVDGSVLTKVPDAASTFCAEVTGTYTIDVVDDGHRLDATVQEDPCLWRSSEFSQGLNRRADAES
jgi:hypothetical protein